MVPPRKRARFFNPQYLSNEAAELIVIRPMEVVKTEPGLEEDEEEEETCSTNCSVGVNTDIDMQRFDEILEVSAERKNTIQADRILDLEPIEKETGEGNPLSTISPGSSPAALTDAVKMTLPAENGIENTEVKEADEIVLSVANVEQPDVSIKEVASNEVDAGKMTLPVENGIENTEVKEADEIVLSVEQPDVSSKEVASNEVDAIARLLEDVVERGADERNQESNSVKDDDSDNVIEEGSVANGTEVVEEESKVSDVMTDKDFRHDRIINDDVNLSANFVNEVVPCIFGPVDSKHEPVRAETDDITDRIDEEGDEVSKSVSEDESSDASFFSNQIQQFEDVKVNGELDNAASSSGTSTDHDLLQPSNSSGVMMRLCRRENPDEERTSPWQNPLEFLPPVELGTVCCVCDGIGNDIMRCTGMCQEYYHPRCLGLSDSPGESFTCDPCRAGGC